MFKPIFQGYLLDIPFNKTHLWDKHKRQLITIEGLLKRGWGRERDRKKRQRILNKNIIQPNAAMDTETKEFLTSTKPNCKMK